MPTFYSGEWTVSRKSSTLWWELLLLFCGFSLLIRPSFFSPWLLPFVLDLSPPNCPSTNAPTVFSGHRLHLVSIRVSLRLRDSPWPLIWQEVLGGRQRCGCLGEALMRLTLVAEAAHPALAAEALPCLLACAVQAAGEGHTPVTVLSLPPRFAPERGS